MPKGYLIVTEAIHDPELMATYGQASAAPVVEYGGKVLAVDEDVHVLEGTWHGTRTVVVEFESVEKAQAWYDSPGYQAVLPLRQAAAECNAVILTGFR
jgi:uncharacterized protein (DUF1330 family)